MKNKKLIGIFLRCCAQTDFVVYANETLCTHDRSNLKFLYCKAKLPSHQNITYTFCISRENDTRAREQRCIFYLVFEGRLSNGIVVKEKSKPNVFSGAFVGNPISSAQVLHIANSAFVTNASSLLAQLSATSTSSRQVQLENATRTSSQIR